MDKKEISQIAAAIYGNFTSEHVEDSNPEGANVVDVISNVASALNRIADVAEHIAGELEKSEYFKSRAWR